MKQRKHSRGGEARALPAVRLSWSSSVHSTLRGAQPAHGVILGTQVRGALSPVSPFSDESGVQTASDAQHTAERSGEGPPWRALTPGV